MGDGMLVVMFGEGVDAAMLFSMSAEMNGTLDSLTEEIQISLVWQTMAQTWCWHGLISIAQVVLNVQSLMRNVIAEKCLLIVPVRVIQ